MASPKDNDRTSTKKTTTIGKGKHTKQRKPGPYGGNKGYKKKYRGQGKG